MFQRVLIANRGEIACRIIRTLHRLGIEAIAVHSDADRDALHVGLADRALRIGPGPAAESYLRIEGVLEAAARSGADAIHPGYGFLAENAAFARACAEAGLAFVGPPAEVIELMGAKDRAKAAMAQAGVPVLPGYGGRDQDEAALRRAADEIGFPLLIKAAAGGGGKGMRRVDGVADFAAALQGAKREALNAFGDDRVLLERLVARPRHIEVQVFGDRHGNVVHLFERDCSIQRRHQKVIEEAPAPGLSEEQRSALGEVAVRAARAVGYVGAGTVEMLMDRDGRFRFMEMNTRLQVEHPVTERITGLDLVEWQLRVAAGEPLPLAQDEITIDGAAIEARLYAEDPATGFLPASGRLHHVGIPSPGAWGDAHVGARSGDVVTTHYDPMLAKLVVHGSDRTEALARLRSWLRKVEIAGPATNLGFLSALTAHPDVVAGAVDTGFVARSLDQLLPAQETEPQVLAAIAAWLLARSEEEARERRAASSEPDSPWHRVDGWRLNGVGHQTLRLVLDQRIIEIDARPSDRGHRLAVGDLEFEASAVRLDDGRFRIQLDGDTSSARFLAVGATIHAMGAFGHHRVQLFDPLAAAAPSDEAEGALIAPMPGKVVRQLVTAGQEVPRGTPLLVLEAMKMEHTIRAPADGRIETLHCQEGDQVEEGVVLLEFEADADG